MYERLQTCFVGCGVLVNERLHTGILLAVEF